MLRYIQTLFIQANQSTVANGLHVLKGIVMIRLARGRVTILDGDKLKDFSDDSYRRAATRHRRRNKQFAKPNCKRESTKGAIVNGRSCERPAFSFLTAPSTDGALMRGNYPFCGPNSCRREWP